MRDTFCDVGFNVVGGGEIHASKGFKKRWLRLTCVEGV